MVDETRPADSSQEAPETASDAAVSEGEMPKTDAVADTDANIETPSTLDEAASDGTEDITASSPDALESAEISELEAEIANLKAQLDDRKGQYVRIAADFENYRRRTAKEREDQELNIKCSTISELLPVIDNFERARSQIKPQTEPEMTIHKSYQSVYKQLVDCLKRLGVSAMRAEGQEFDPNLHEAVLREPTDQHDEGTVIEELVRGYVVGERVLRHAMVKVAAPPEPASEDTAEPGDSES